MKKTLHALGVSALLALSILGAPSTFASGGDLSVGSSSVWFSTDSYLEGNTIRIWASVANNSSEDLLGSVHLTANGNQIGSDQAVSALAGKTDEVFVDWTPSTYGTYSIQVTVTPWEATGDDGSNNSTSKSVTVVQDTDRDGISNASDADDDNDGVLDSEDAFPTNRDEIKDSDGDGKGNNADTDDDNDGTLDVDDQLPEDPKFTKDMDGDGFADEIDEDIDGDLLSNEAETSTGTMMVVRDTDGDFVIDGTDAFPLDPTEWSDVDGDGMGDNSDLDIDGDEILNEEDSDPSNPAPNAEADQDVFLTSLDEEVTFDASESVDDGGIVKYVWQFDEETVEGPTVTKSFDSSGLKVAPLTVYDAEGQSDSVQVKVHVFDKAFLVKAISFSLLLLLLAFYLIYRYNRRASGKNANKHPGAKQKNGAQATPNKR